ncbi:ABC-type nitrate/sulfonate/bicarbonate transport system, substrate-binding protein [Polaromonas sp. YR568]|uniref:ABC transporter substrate-binding protein n=1 Tax=Polaromonas sp. YR568 TaxID=1855301 RepID=UPI0008E6D488|nr:ABC transporter substrate-binding protein [Polaromonas sp. YR568]SFU29252.1 ABC-type nitrate/sulfonate/bicarbonate transport system, substrate-binding protein [Polaromonas sp. YR568]
MTITRFLGLAALSLGLFATQGHAAPPLEKTEIRYQGWAGQVTWIELAEELGYLAPLKAKWVGNTISGPQDIQSVVTGDVDLGGAFNGAVVKLLAKKAPIKAVLGYYGVDENTYSGYYVKDDSPIKSARDLLGKKVAVNTLGAHHEFMVREYLDRAKLSDAEAKQVTLVVTPPVTGEQALRQGHVEVTTLGGVLRDKALERGGIHPLFTDRALYGNFTAGTIVLHNKFIEQNPNTSRHLVSALARSIEWARNTPAAEVRARFVKVIEARKRAESADTIQYWKSTGVAGTGGVIKDSELQIWINWLVKDGLLKPGQVKPADLYTNAFNPYFNNAEKLAAAK